MEKKLDWCQKQYSRFIHFNDNDRRPVRFRISASSTRTRFNRRRILFFAYGNVTSHCSFVRRIIKSAKYKLDFKYEDETDKIRLYDVVKFSIKGGCQLIIWLARPPQYTALDTGRTGRKWEKVENDSCL